MHNWNQYKLSRLWTYYDKICGYLIGDLQSRLFYLEYNGDFKVVGLDNKEHKLDETKSVIKLKERVYQLALRNGLMYQVDKVHEAINRYNNSDIDDIPCDYDWGLADECFIEGYGGLDYGCYS